MQLVDKPAIFPGACVCGTTTNGPFLDTGLLDAAGKRIYLCNTHFLEALRVEKLVPLAELEQQNVRLGEAHAQIAQLEERERADVLGVQALQRQLDENAATIDTLRVGNEILEQRVADMRAQTDPAVAARAERQRQIAELISHSRSAA